MEKFLLHFFGTLESVWNMLTSISHSDLGFISTFLLTVCSFQLLWRTFRDGHCKAIPGWFIITWWLGDVTGIIYVVPSQDVPLILNYGLNFIAASTMLVYKIKRG